LTLCRAERGQDGRSVSSRWARSQRGGLTNPEPFRIKSEPKVNLSRLSERMPQALKTELITTALSQNRSGSFAAVLGSFARACPLICVCRPAEIQRRIDLVGGRLPRHLSINRHLREKARSGRQCCRKLDSLSSARSLAPTSWDSDFWQHRTREV
jgi:hypothetical protein